jgi:hypothetical protein
MDRIGAGQSDPDHRAKANRIDDEGHAVVAFSPNAI